MTDKKTSRKVCVIGGGRWGQNHIRTLYEMGNLYGIVDSDLSRLTELSRKYPEAKAYTSVESAIEDGYHGYVIATPAETHFSIGSFLLNRNQNVLIEKPLALSSADSVKLIELAQESGSRLMVGHVLLFHPAILKIKEAIDGGFIGNLLYMYSNRLNLGTVRTEENVFWSFAPHDISVFNFLIGKSPVFMHASGGCFLQKEIHDSVIAFFAYPDNIKGHIFVSWLHPYKEQKLVVIGSEGMLTFEDSSPEKRVLYHKKGIAWVNGKPVKREEAEEIIPYDMSSPLENELKYFIEHLDMEIEISDGRSAHEVVRILEQASRCLTLENDMNREAAVC